MPPEAGCSFQIPPPGPARLRLPGWSEPQGLRKGGHDAISQMEKPRHRPATAGEPREGLGGTDLSLRPDAQWAPSQAWDRALRKH